MTGRRCFLCVFQEVWYGVLEFQDREKRNCWFHILGEHSAWEFDMFFVHSLRVLEAEDGTLVHWKWLLFEDRNHLDGTKARPFQDSFVQPWPGL